MVGAEQFNELEKVTIEPKQILPLEDRSSITNNTYILGPGDGLIIELLDLPELSGNFTIGPDGTLFLPRLRAIYVEGLTVEELRKFLIEKFSTYVRDPQVFVQPVIYRPIRIYVGGEVKRPGYYTLGGSNNSGKMAQAEMPGYYTLGGSNNSGKMAQAEMAAGYLMTSNQKSSKTSKIAASSFGPTFALPTVFDAIRSAQGITLFSNLSKVQVTRKRPLSLGGGQIRANLNFLSLITNGNESQNIRLFDGDVVNVSKSNMVMRDQLLKAGQTNLSPEFINVYVSGRVNSPGAITLPQGAFLNQALAMAGGTKLLKGKIEFIRFTQDGKLERSRIRYNPGAAANTPNNPALISGDLIKVNNSLISSSNELLTELTSPFIGVYSLYSIFNNN